MRVDPVEIEALVRQVLSRTLGNQTGKDPSGRSILGEDTVRAMPVGSTHHVAPGTVVTPLARQVAMERRINLVEGQAEKPQPVPGPLRHEGRQVIALGADHGGYEMKEVLKEVLGAAGYGFVDCGTFDKNSVDYPDYAYAVAQLVANGQAWRGIVVDGAGIGSCMTANKVPGVRAAMCYDQATAVNSREHNNANVLTLGAGLIGMHLARQIVTTWLETEFAGGRHARRVDKIDALDRRFQRK